MRRMKHLTIALLLLVLPYPAWAQRVDATISGKVVRVSDPQITPDGRAVAIVVARANFTDNRWDSEVVIVEAATRAQRVIAPGTAVALTGRAADAVPVRAGSRS